MVSLYLMLTVIMGSVQIHYICNISILPDYSGIALLHGKFVTDQLITTDLQPEAMKISLACCIMEFFVCPGSLVATLKGSTPVLFMQVKPSKFIR